MQKILRVYEENARLMEELTVARAFDQEENARLKMKLASAQASASGEP